MKKKNYHKPGMVAINKINNKQSIQLAGVRAIPTMVLKSELKNK